MERRIDDLVVADPPLAVAEDYMADLTPPTFHERHYEPVRGERADRPPDRSVDKVSELLDEKLAGTTNLQRAHQGSRLHVAPRTGRVRDVIEAIDATGKVAAHVAVDSRGPGYRSHESQGLGHVARNDAHVLEA